MEQKWSRSRKPTAPKRNNNFDQHGDKEELYFRAQAFKSCQNSRQGNRGRENVPDSRRHRAGCIAIPARHRTPSESNSARLRCQFSSSEAITSEDLWHALSSEIGSTGVPYTASHRMVSRL